MSDTGVCITIRQTLQRELRDAGIDDLQAKKIIHNVERSLLRSHGGDRAYLPSESAMTKKQRNESIIGEWKNGERNRLRLAKKYYLDKSTVTRIINQHLARQQKKSLDNWSL